MVTGMMRAMWVVGVAVFVCTGCGPDLYAPCQLNESEDEFVRACGSTNVDRSCAVEGYTQCDTRVCARYEGSKAFCTATCASDSDCGSGGRCVEFVIQTGARYCVNDTVAADKQL